MTKPKGKGGLDCTSCINFKKYAVFEKHTLYINKTDFSRIMLLIDRILPFDT